MDFTTIAVADAGKNDSGIFSVPPDSQGYFLKLDTSGLGPDDFCVVVTTDSKDGGKTFHHNCTFTCWATDPVAVSERGWQGKADENGDKILDVPTHVRFYILSPQPMTINMGVSWL
jgi:hypothetical protein